LASLSQGLFAVLEFVQCPYQSEMSDGASLVPRDVLLALLGALALLGVPVLLSVPVPRDALLLSYYQLAALAVALEDMLPGLPFHPVEDDSVAGEIGKRHFLAWTELSQRAEPVQDGYPQMLECLEYYAESICCSPERDAEPHRSYYRRYDR
jgi:hypothetical protein